MDISWYYFLSCVVEQDPTFFNSVERNYLERSEGNSCSEIIDNYDCQQAKACQSLYEDNNDIFLSCVQNPVDGVPQTFSTLI